MNCYINSTNSELEFIRAILQLFYIKVKINIYNFWYLLKTRRDYIYI